MKKKASMSLSVNAIVVLVLAFALLGVGIVFVNFLKDTLLTQTTEAIGLHDLENPPTADRPIAFPQDINVPQGESASFNMGFYNKESTPINDVYLEISQCIRQGESSPIDTLPTITTLPETEIKPSQAVAYRMFINLEEPEDELGYVKGTYICTIEVVNADDSFAKHSFFLHVV
ncbi:MAG: hypothetical protein ACLFPJ_02835 [Candidatus Woesearchaeota archaeon]